MDETNHKNLSKVSNKNDDQEGASEYSYNFRRIEKEWQKKWGDSGIYHVSNSSEKPKCYVLDMFPYPSGAGLHVGHPLGYIASDIYARYKRLKGFNVLHPMGYDSFGLPAEQYALETGQHPAVTTEKNIETFRTQLDNIGFCFDWTREVRTSDPKYYKWTQWIFLQIFNSWYDKKQNKARRIEELIKIFEEQGSSIINDQATIIFTAEEWKNLNNEERQEILMDYRLAYSAFGEVNWCEALGTVLANDEVINGVSERGGHPVVKRKMRQWYLRITDYAERLLHGLETVDFSDSMKEMQSNWIGKSEGAEMEFKIKNEKSTVTVYTTRPDTIFGVDFMVLAPEHDLTDQITTPAQKEEIEKYLEYVKSRSERERLAEVKSITGAFTGAYAINPFDGREIPIWISEYVLAGYGTGAIMAVPCGDQRDFSFAKYFNIPITNIIGDYYNGEEANATKEAILINSDFLNGLIMRDAMPIVLQKIEEMGIGKRKINYKMRDAGFSRQRYWGEPFPIIYKNGVAYPVDEKELPVELPHVENYKPGPDGQGPLANITAWVDLTPGPSPKERGEKESGEEKDNREAGLDYMSTDAETWKNLKPFARENRKEQTEAEELLWQNIRNRKISNCKFRRQHAIGGFIVDFVCIEKKLVIEIDGGYHEEEEQRKYDKSRTEYLQEQGFTEIRFSNKEVIQSLSQTIQNIEKSIAKTPPLLWRGVRGEVKRETNTMPGYAGSSWYFLRYMDPHNDQEFADKKVTDYWNQVDVYVGGTEHAVGHLLYSRMWTKVLFDLGYINFDEPFKKLVNQGMIQGVSEKLIRASKNNIDEPTETDQPNRVTSSSNRFYITWLKDSFSFHIDESEDYFIIQYSSELKSAFPFGESEINVPIEFVNNEVLDVGMYSELLKQQGNGYQVYVCKDGFYNSKYKKWFNFKREEIKPLEFKTMAVVEKMSKSKRNVINPNEIINKYGADTFRMYEMFLGPVEASKPWDTKGIEGVHRFLKKLWRLFYDDIKGEVWNNEKANEAELKVLHKAIKKIEEDTERFSYNTAVSAFMICINELSDLKCHKQEILKPLLILITPYAPHIAEELYQRLHPLSFGEGRDEVSILNAAFPKLESKYLVESEKEYPVSINARMRTSIKISLDASAEDVEKIVLQNEVVKKWMEGKPLKKIIYVKNKMINVLV